MDEFNEGVERVTAGPGKKQRVMNDDGEAARGVSAKAAHALVAYSLPNTDPVSTRSRSSPAAWPHSATRCSVRRGSVPDDPVGTGEPYPGADGRHVAEEMVYADISTGRARTTGNVATAIARSMVMEYGMSRLGRINFGGARDPRSWPGRLAMTGPQPTANRRRARSTKR